MKPRRKRINIRLRHIALAAFVVAAIALATSNGLTSQKYSGYEWFLLINEALMWTCFGLLFYTYVGYPIVFGPFCHDIWPSGQ